MEKSIPELKAEFMCIVGKRKKKQFQNSCNHFKVYKKCKSPIQKASSICRTSYQNILFLLETVLEMAKERNKGDVEIMCAKVTKHASKKVAKA